MSKVQDRSVSSMPPLPPEKLEMVPVYNAKERSASGYPLHTPKETTDVHST
ncbi:MAG: hypothetical protein HC888_01495 [Candidatus Competibacteraceae bacterium]|nr:hypothetical protein [Candidatus Competibacteraceae bacterium]